MLREEFEAVYDELCMNYGFGNTPLRQRQCAAWFKRFGAKEEYIVRRAFGVLAETKDRFPALVDVLGALNACTERNQMFSTCDDCGGSGMRTESIEGRSWTFACRCVAGDVYRQGWRSTFGGPREPLDDYGAWRNRHTSKETS